MNDPTGYAAGLCLRGVLAALVLSLSATFASAQTPKPPPAALPFVLKQIGPGVYAAIDGPQGTSGSNAGVIIGDDGVLVVDSFFNPNAAKALLAEIHKITPKPVRYVVNTHYHADHVGGDNVFRDAGAIIIAHRNVHGWVRTENAHLFGDKITPAQRDFIAHLALPDLTIDKGMTVWLGARKVEVRAELGHTGGDLTIAVPDAHVLFCGDLLWRHTLPNIIDGTVSQWIATDDRFQHLPDAAAMTFVPGHGDVATVKDVADFEGYLTDLSTMTADARRAGLSGDALVAAVKPKLKARYGDWDAFDYFAAKEIGFMDAELAGTKRVPVPRAD
jgi:glyoxylase-like metal-dependent hydrolase (beta-lactamase superfamily II)